MGILTELRTQIPDYASLSSEELAAILYQSDERFNSMEYKDYLETVGYGEDLKATGGEGVGILGETARSLGRGIVDIVGTFPEIADFGLRMASSGEDSFAEDIREGLTLPALETLDAIRQSDTLRESYEAQTGDYTNLRWWLANAPQAATSMVTPIAGAGIASKAIKLKKGFQALTAAKKAATIGKAGAIGAGVAGIALETAGQAGAARQAHAQGVELDKGTEAFSVIGTGLLAGGLEAATGLSWFNKLFGGQGDEIAKYTYNKLLKEVPAGILKEGSTEAAQEVIANAFAELGIDPDRELLDGATESFLLGGLLGAGGGTVAGVQQNIRDRQGDKLQRLLDDSKKASEGLPSIDEDAYFSDNEVEQQRLASLANAQAKNLQDQQAAVVPDLKGAQVVARQQFDREFTTEETTLPPQQAEIFQKQNAKEAEIQYEQEIARMLSEGDGTITELEETKAKENALAAVRLKNFRQTTKGVTVTGKEIIQERGDVAADIERGDVTVPNRVPNTTNTGTIPAFNTITQAKEVYDIQTTGKGNRFKIQKRAETAAKQSDKEVVKVGSTYYLAEPITEQTETSLLGDINKSPVQQGQVTEDNKAEAFSELGEAQRGKPESAMVAYQMEAGGGVMGYALEHVGDLTHRMTTLFKYRQDGGKEFVVEKVKKALRILKQEYGFEKEHNENVASNYQNNTTGRGAKFRPGFADKFKTEKSFKNNLDTLANNYADEHAKLPVYNEPQKLARDAAVALGRGEFDVAIKNLESIQEMLDNGTYEEKATQLDTNLAPIGGSRLANIIEVLGAKRQRASDWIRTLNQWNNKTLPPALQEELAWSGLREVLEVYGDVRLSKAEVLAMLKDNNIRVEVDTSEQYKYSGMRLFGTTTSTDYKVLKVTLKEPHLNKVAIKEFGKPFNELSKKELRVLKSLLDGKFTMSHFEAGDLLVFIRMDTRKSSGGDKTLFLNEIQSDYAAAARDTHIPIVARKRLAEFNSLEEEASTLADKEIKIKKERRELVYQEDVGIDKFSDITTYLAKKNIKHTIQLTNNPSYIDFQLGSDEEVFKVDLKNAILLAVEEANKEKFNEFDKRILEAQQAFNANREEASKLHEEFVTANRAIPDAPFIKSDTTWSMLGFKKALEHAITNGYDAVALPGTAEQIYDIETWGEVDRRELYQLTWTNPVTKNQIETAATETLEEAEELLKRNVESPITNDKREDYKITKQVRYLAPDGQDVTSIIERTISRMPKRINQFLQKQLGLKDHKVERGSLSSETSVKIGGIRTPINRFSDTEIKGLKFLASLGDISASERNSLIDAEIARLIGEARDASNVTESLEIADGITLLKNRRNKAISIIKGAASTINIVKITPELKKTLSQGVPLFSNISSDTIAIANAIAQSSNDSRVKRLVREESVDAKSILASISRPDRNYAPARQYKSNISVAKTKALAKLLLDRYSSLLKDLPIRLASPKEVLQWQTKFGTKEFYYHTPRNANGVQEIVINPGMSQGANHSLDITLLHEIIHGLTVIQLEEASLKGVQFRDEMYAILEKAKENAIKLGVFKDFADMTTLAGQSRGTEKYFIAYALQNPKELLSMAFTNKEVQKFLQRIDSVGKGSPSLWKRFTNALKKLFSIRAGSLLEDVITTGTNLMEGQLQMSEKGITDSGISANPGVATRIRRDGNRLNHSPVVEYLKIDDSEVEARFKASKLKKGDTGLYKRLTKKVRAAYHSFRRHYKELNPKIYGLLTDTLRIFEQTPSYSRTAALYNLQLITSGLNKFQLDTFTKHIILQDLLRDVESGKYDFSEGLPFGFTKDSLKRNATTFKNAVRDDKQLSESLKIRNDKFGILRKALVDKGILHESVLDDDRYFHHQVLLYKQAEDATKEGLSSGSVKAVQKGWQKARTASLEDYNTDYLQAEYEVLSQAIAQLQTRRIIEEILHDPKANLMPRIIKYINDNKIFVENRKQQKARESKGEKAPEGSMTWNRLLLDKDLLAHLEVESLKFFRPISNQAFSQGNTTADKAIARQLEENGVDIEGEMIDTMGGLEGTLMITDGKVYNTLKEFRKFKDEPIVADISDYLINGWKKWTLLNPFRVFRYNLNNLSGDIDIVLAYNPKILKPLMLADTIRELVGFTHNKTELLTDVEAKRLELAFRLGVIDSGFSTADMGDLRADIDADIFLHPDESKIRKTLKFLKDMPRRYTTLRENILRYQAFKHFQAEIKAGKVVYGASNKAQVDAVQDTDRKAAKLARELIGDYGNISHSGQWLRKHMIPFYSWMEINAPRYFRLLNNTRYEDKGVAGIAGVTAWKTTKLGIKAGAMYGLVQLWNATFFPEEEEEIGEGKNKQLHLILGRREDGTIVSISFNGAFGDMLDWVDLGDVRTDVADLASGKKTYSDQMIEMMRRPLEKWWQGSRPVVKMTGELATGFSTYPELWSPRPIRDKLEHIARTFSLEMPYRHLRGELSTGLDRPTRGLLADLATLVVYSDDPREMAYYDTRKAVYDYLDKQGLERPAAKPTSKGNALYYYKQALKFGQIKLAFGYLKEYQKLGGTTSGLGKSIKRVHPLGALPNRLRRKFIASLSSKDRKKLFTSIRWYNDVYGERGRRIR